jgi:hypothetical protein
MSVEVAFNCFEDPTVTGFDGQRQPRRTWIASLYLMGMNLSGLQIENKQNINKC